MSSKILNLCIHFFSRLNINLYYIITGDNSIKVKVFKDGGNLESFRFQRENSVTMFYSMRPVKAADKGTYQCQAEHGGKVLTRDVKVELIEHLYANPIWHYDNQTKEVHLEKGFLVKLCIWSTNYVLVNLV